ncbi:MAG: LPS export ABC transporter periplasmic protein LptC [Desulfuromonadales bacterium]|nr:LPS export ABC transporter periplasmic protein LptC [Desulfuromonadales bacterium]
MVSPRNIRLVLALLVVAASIGIVAAIFLKGSRTPLQGTISQQLPRNIDVALKNARFTEMREGVTVWELVAAQVEYDKTGDIAYLADIRMVYAARGKNGSITVTAAKGDYSAASRNIRLRGTVHVVTGSGMVFDTESLDYLAEKSHFRTADKVKILHERLSLTATGMELDAKTERAHFHSSVDAVVEGL